MHSEGKGSYNSEGKGFTATSSQTKSYRTGEGRQPFSSITETPLGFRHLTSKTMSRLGAPWHALEQVLQQALAATLIYCLPS